jgi:hypothetical protein
MSCLTIVVGILLKCQKSIMKLDQEEKDTLLKQLNDETWQELMRCKRTPEDGVPIKGEGNVTPHF